MTTLINTALANNFYVEPLNVNPNWLIDQLYEGATATTTATAGGAATQIADGWTVSLINPSGVGNGAIRTSVVTDPDFASRKALKIECITADTTVSAGDLYHLYSAIEGFDLASLNAGTASASTITVQFQFKSNKTGTYAVRVGNGGGNRSYVGLITVADTSVHDYSVTLTLDTSGTWLYTNGVGAYVSLTLMAGSTWQTTAGAWQAGNFYATSSQVNFLDANTNVAYLGRFHVIPGNVVRAYKPADIRRELAKAQRYYAKSVSQGSAPGGALGDGDLRWVATGAFNPDAFAIWKYPVTMRATPTTTIYSPITGASGNCRNYSSGADEAAAVVGAGTSHLNIYNSSTGTAGHQYGAYAVANARLS